MKKIFIFLTLISGIFCSAWSQNFITVNVLNSADNKKQEAIKIKDIKADVQVTGTIATTTVEMELHNFEKRVLEGEIEFPLGKGQSVIGYALDINGKLRDGVVVEKDKGRVVFEDITRRNVDPGLLEKTSGNNYRIRVYPFNPDASRFVKIVIQQDLSTAANIYDKSSKYCRVYEFMPLSASPVENFSFTMEVFKQKIKPKVIENNENNIVFNSWNSGFNASFTKKGYVQKKALKIFIPSEFISSDNVFMQEYGKDSYFYINAFSDRGLSQSPESKKQKIDGIRIYYDVSSSAENRDIEKETELICSYVEKNNIDAIEFIPFNYTLKQKEVFYNTKELKNYISKLKFDGATSLGCVDFDTAVFDAIKIDGILLVTDGISNWKEAYPKTKGYTIVNVINSSLSADYSMLEKIARDNHGITVDVNRYSVEENLSFLSTQAYRIISIDYDKTAVTEVYPAPGSIVEGFGDINVCGILKKKSAQIKIFLGYGNKVTETLTYNISSVREDDALKLDVIQLWAAKKIEELNMNYKENKDEIIALAKKHKVVTKDTSLIVLETVQDYVKYEIVPPEELIEQYNNLIRNKNSNVPRDGISPEVIKDFEEFKKWWLTTPEEFRKIQSPKEKRTVNRSRSSSANSSDEVYLEAEAFNEAVLYESEAVVPAAARDVQAKKEGGSQRGTQAAVSLQAWSPDSSYLVELKRTSVNKMYDKYLELKKTFGESPSFYIETADYFKDEKLDKEALTILSNLAEMNLENADIMRALGTKLSEWNAFEEAVDILEKTVKMKGEIPMFYRDLGLAYAELSKVSKGDDKLEYYKKALDTLYYIVEHPWDARYAHLQQIALNDMQGIIAASGIKGKFTSKYDQRIMENFPVDVRIVLTWNTDDCDIDLWVTDPDKEKCYYAHRLTKNGGRMSRDFTQGYGPEEFCIKKAPSGTYKIEANYYGTRSQKILQPVIVHAEVYTNFGKPNQTKQVLTLQLKTVKGSYTIGEISVK
ncbi:MAG: DUF2135 domain-containing protein [Treponema sp.]|nr:DUF2135 domain-containing protein [Treponema sp.]